MGQSCDQNMHLQIFSPVLLDVSKTSDIMVSA